MELRCGALQRLERRLHKGTVTDTRQNPRPQTKVDEESVIHPIRLATALPGSTNVGKSLRPRD